MNTCDLKHYDEEEIRIKYDHIKTADYGEERTNKIVKQVSILSSGRSGGGAQTNNNKNLFWNWINGGGNTELGYWNRGGDIDGFRGGSVGWRLYDIYKTKNQEEETINMRRGMFNEIKATCTCENNDEWVIRTGALP